MRFSRRSHARWALFTWKWQFMIRHFYYLTRVWAVAAYMCASLFATMAWEHYPGKSMPLRSIWLANVFLMFSSALLYGILINRMSRSPNDRICPRDYLTNAVNYCEQRSMPEFLESYWHKHLVFSDIRCACGACSPTKGEENV